MVKKRGVDVNRQPRRHSAAAEVLPERALRRVTGGSIALGNPPPKDDPPPGIIALAGNDQTKTTKP